MREYAKVSPQFWIGETGKEIRAMGPEAQVMALYLLTSPHSNRLGLYYVPLPLLCHETGLPLEGALKALRSLSEVGFCTFDAASEWVWIPEMAKFQIGVALDPHDNNVRGLAKEYAKLPNNPFLQAFFARYGAAYHLRDARAFKAPSKSLRSMEMEMEIEREREISSAHADVVAPARGADVCVLRPGESSGRAKPGASPQAIDEFIEGWNAVCASEGLPYKTHPTPALRDKIRRRLGEHPEEAFWQEVFNVVRRSDFLRGRLPGKPWKASLGWLVKNAENAVKVYEGEYGGLLQRTGRARAADERPRGAARATELA
jgi:hypothetical protein